MATAERDGLPPLKFWWYDGKPNDPDVKAMRPHDDIVSDVIALSAGQKDKNGKDKPAALPTSGDCATSFGSFSNAARALFSASLRSLPGASWVPSRLWQ